MASGRRSLTRNYSTEIFIDVNADSDFSEDSDYDANDGTDESDSDDPLYDENLSESDLCVYENSDRANSDLDKNWSTDVRPIRQFPFLTDPGGTTNIHITSESTPREVFDQIFTENIMEMIVSATNEYGRELYAKPVPKSRKSPKVVFQDTNANEMYKFFGLSFLMAQCKFPTIRNAFSKHPLYFHPIFPATMSGRRYQMLLRAFNCHTPFREGEKQDKLVKVNRLVDALIKSFNDAYTPGKNLSLDESLLLFRGRLSFRQYIKNKAAKYGIKFYELTTNDGYVLNLTIYQGDQGNNTNSNESGGKTEKIVEPDLNKGHNLFMDNFYNSYSLSTYLLSKQTHVTGTLRANRKYNPKDVIEAKLKKGEIIWRRSGEVYVTKWKDKRDVLSITTAHHPQLVEAANRFGEIKLKPKDVKDYNHNMGGIDRLDQMTAYYSSPRKTIRWYKKVLFHLLDMAVWNSYFLYRKQHQKATFIQFRDSLIMSMVRLPRHIQEGRQLVDMVPSVGRPISNLGEPQLETEQFADRHHMEKIPIPDTHQPSYYQRCKYCAEKKVRKQTCYLCIGCPGKPPICLECFKEKHE